jgi:peptide/nickel transport system ATP-binding protein
MYGGTIVEQGPTAQVFARLAHPYTQGLFAARPRLGGRGAVRDARARLVTIPGRVPDLFDMQQRLKGCPFADRCERVVDACHSAPPAAVTVGPAHEARCLRIAA